MHAWVGVSVFCVCVYMCVSGVGTRLSHPGQPSHVLSRSTGSTLVHKISGSDPDFALDYVHELIMLFGPDQIIN